MQTCNPLSQDGHYDFVQLHWTNPDCEGFPQQTIFNSDICYPSSFAQGFPPGICHLDSIGFFKYECRVANYHADGEAIDGSGDVPMNSDMNTGIFAAIFLFVCLIGMIFGYLIHRRTKKKSAQRRDKLLACDEKENKTDNL